MFGVVKFHGNCSLQESVRLGLDKVFFLEYALEFGRGDHNFLRVGFAHPLAKLSTRLDLVEEAEAFDYANTKSL